MKNKIDLSKHTTLIAFVILFVSLSILSPNFLTSNNLIQVLRQIAINGLIASGMTYVILTGGIDLSVGSTLAFSSMSTVLLVNGGIPVFFAVLIGLLIGFGIGAINGIFIAKMKLQPFIVTLATMTIVRGLTLVISSSKPVSVVNQKEAYQFIGQSYILGIPLPVIIFLITFVILGFILLKTTFGKKLYATGGNEEVARLSGIKTDKVKIIVYGLSGLMAALAGIVLTSRLDSGQPLLGSGFELDAIAAVVIGGTSLVGGKGSIVGTFIGVLIIGILNNGLNLLNVQSEYQEIVKGAVILLAVLLDRLKKE